MILIDAWGLFHSRGWIEATQKEKYTNWEDHSLFMDLSAYIAHSLYKERVERSRRPSEAK